MKSAVAFAIRGECQAPETFRGITRAPSAFGQVAGLSHHFRGAGNHRLLRGVEVGQGDGAFLGQGMDEALQFLRGQADDRHHGAGIFLGLPLHEAAALGHRGQGVGGAQHPGGVQGAVFPQAVAAHRPGLDPGGLQGLIETEIDHGDGRLEIHRLGEFLHGAFKTEALQGQAGGLFGQVEQLPGAGSRYHKGPGPCPRTGNPGREK